MRFLDQMQADPVFTAARAKMGDLPENFRMYCYEWLGDMSTEACVMKLTGCEFRAAKSGPRKGQLAIEIPGTKREAYLTSAEVKEAIKRVPQASQEGEQPTIKEKN